VADDTTVEDTTIEGSEACATDKRIQERTEKNEEKGKRRASDGQEETGTEQGKASDERGMGIRHGNWGPESNSLELNQATAALEAVSGADMAMWNNHFGGPSSSERTDENDGPNGYVQDEVRGTKPELDVIENAVAEAYGESRFSPVGQQILAHIYHCQTAKPWQHKEGVPIDHRLIKKACREEGLGEVSATSDVWWPLAQAGYLYYEDYEEGVVTRRFHLASPFIHRLRIAERNGYDTKTRYNLVDGSRKYGKQKTKLTYDGTHSWDQKSEFIYEALEALQGQRDLVNTQAVERHLSRLEVRKGEALPALSGLSEGDFEAEDLSVAFFANADHNHCRRRADCTRRRTFSCIASAKRNGYSSSSGRSAQAATCSSSFSVRLLTVCRLNSRPHSSVVISFTRRVDTPSITICIRVVTNAFSDR